MNILLLGQHEFSGSTGGHDVRHAPPAATLKRLLTDGWRPDLIVHRNPAYHVVPSDIGAAPCATVAMLSDWNVHFDAVMAVLPAFDHVVTDRRGVEVLQRAGLSHVSYFPLFGYAPARHFRPAPQPAAEYDVSIVANLNPHLQRARAPWLGRLAALGSRWRVGVCSGLYGEAYARVVQRSRVTFNRSIRGEMNMRAFEAPACGSMLLLEEENLEVRDFLQPGVECVLYGACDFEDVCSYYLEHEAERARIAEAGWRAVQPHTYEQRLLDLIVECAAKGLAGPRRRVHHLGASAESAARYARQAQTCVEDAARREAVRLLRAALPEQSDHPEALNNLAVCLALTPSDDEGATRVEVESYLTWAAALQPNPVAQLNRAAFAERVGDTELAARMLQEAIVRLDDVGEVPLDGLLLAPPYEAFRMAWEQAGWEHDPGRRRALLRGEAWFRIGLLLERGGHHEVARPAFECAVEAFPQVEALFALSRSREALGDLPGAIDAATRGLGECPLHVPLAWRRILLLGRAGRAEEMRQALVAFLELAHALRQATIETVPARRALRDVTLELYRRRAGSPAYLAAILQDALRFMPRDHTLERLAQRTAAAR